MRTAAASAVASQEIVPPSHSASSADAVVIAIIGTGPVAAAHLHAFALAYPAANFLIVSRLLQVHSPLSHLHTGPHRL
jgi:ornithine cyclodeaminase/alanine dehydrogenase-like protein (mu-crystallin family)